MARIVIGKVAMVQNTGHAMRTVQLNTGEEFRVINSQVAYAVDNSEFRETDHEYTVDNRNVYKSHRKVR